MTSFKETINALDVEKKATALAEERFQESLKEWEEIQTLRTTLHPEPASRQFGEGDTLDRITDLTRRFGPTAAKWFGGPAAGAAVASFMADDGGFAGFTGVFSLIGQVFGW